MSDQQRDRFSKLGALLDEAEDDLLACMTFPRAQGPPIDSTQPPARLNAEIKRRTRVVGLFPDHASITRQVGALVLEHNDEWSLNRCCMQLEGLHILSGIVPSPLSAVAR